MLVSYFTFGGTVCYQRFDSEMRMAKKVVKLRAWTEADPAHFVGLALSSGASDGR